MCFIRKEEILPEIIDRLALVLLAVIRALAEICIRNQLLYVCLLITLTSICFLPKPSSELTY